MSAGLGIDMDRVRSARRVEMDWRHSGPAARDGWGLRWTGICNGPALRWVRAEMDWHLQRTDPEMDRD